MVLRTPSMYSPPQVVYRDHRSTYSYVALLVEALVPTPFTVRLTGPSPGLFGYAAHALIEATVAHGIDRQVAERAIRFHAMAAGNEILRSDLSPAKDVQRIMDYAGVTTAALEAAEQSGAMEAFDAALKAAFVIAGKDRT